VSTCFHFGGCFPTDRPADLSEKNPLVMLRNDASLTTLLEIFSRGTHRVLVEGPEQQVKGIITDSTLVKYFASNVRIKPTCLDPNHV
jgi:CBS domain-containing protein